MVVVVLAVFGPAAIPVTIPVLGLYVAGLGSCVQVCSYSCWVEFSCAAEVAMTTDGRLTSVSVLTRMQRNRIPAPVWPPIARLEAAQSSGNVARQQHKV